MPVSPKKYLLLFLSLFLNGLLAFGQGFYIEKFDVNIDLNENGSFEVTETLDCFFTESKHGIFRDIPFKYKVREVNGRKASNRGMVGSEYKIYLEDITVEGHDFRLEDNGPYQRIRIGSASTYVEGKVRYVIKYSVFGAINQFGDFDEFYWNLTGNGWPCTIESVRFKVNLPKTQKLGSEDLKVFTGSLGATGTDASIRQEGRMVFGQTTQKLDAGEGITIGLRFPRNYLKYTGVPQEVLSEKYVISSVTGTATVNEDGTVDISERIILTAKVAGEPFTRAYPRQYSGPSLDSAPKWISSQAGQSGAYGIELGKSWEYYPKSLPTPGLTYVKEMSPSDVLLKLESRYSSPEYQQEFEIRYKVFGAVKMQGDQAFLHLNLWSGTTMEPVGTTFFEVKFPEDRPPVAFKGSRSYFGDPPAVRQEGNSLFISTGDMLNKYEGLNVAASFDGKGMELAPMPMKFLAKDYFISDYEVELQIEPDGWVSERHDIQLEKIGSAYGFDRNIQNIFEPGKPDSPELNYRNLFQRKYRVRLDNIRTSGSTWSYQNRYSGHELNWDYWDQESDTLDFIYSFSRYGLGMAEENGMKFHIPVIEWLEEPASNARIRIEGPEGPLPASTRAIFQILSGDSVFYADTLTPVNGELVWQPAFPLIPRNQVYVKLLLPEGVVSLPITAELGIWWLNNKWLFIPLVVLIILGLLWLVFGRDPRGVNMVHFFPPEGLTPAEAGMLIDNKLHNRDIISLIYYWADKGYLKIEEEDKTGKKRAYEYKYTLVKKANLPSDARDFEQTIFKGIFSGKKTKVKVSSLKHSFYTKMAKARKELEKRASREKFFVPGTRGFAGFLKFLGILSLIAAIGAAGIQWIIGSYAMRGRFDILICFISLFIIFRVFGRIMPKRGPYGQKVWGQLKGFKEFIEKAEKDRLERLLHEDPAYFEHTLSFAIAFGLADKWAEKFKDLEVPAPSWFDSADPSFTPDVFTRSVMNSMSRMNRDFTSRPPSSSGGGSYRSSGGSYSSYSSSGSSGSSFSSGGYSGGGFGGGGGGSW